MKKLVSVVACLGLFAAPALHAEEITIECQVKYYKQSDDKLFDDSPAVFELDTKSEVGISEIWGYQTSYKVKWSSVSVELTPSKPDAWHFLINRKTLGASVLNETAQLYAVIPEPCSLIETRDNRF